MSLFSYISDMIARKNMARKGMLNHSSRRVNQNHSFLHNLWTRSPFPVILMLLLTAVVSCFSLLLPTNEVHIPRVLQNETAGKTIYAQFDFSYEDKAATKRKREEVRQQQPIFYRISTTKKDFDKFYEELVSESGKRARSALGAFSYNFNDSEAGDIIKEMGANTFSVFKQIILDSRLSGLLHQKMYESISSGLLRQVDKKLGGRKSTDSQQQKTSIRVIDASGRNLMAKPVSDFFTPLEASKLVTSELLMHFSSLDRDHLNSELSSAIERILSLFVMKIDSLHTAENVKEALSAVKPVMIQVHKDELLLKSGDMIQEADQIRIDRYRQESKIRFASEHTQTKMIIKNSLFCVILLFFSVIYMLHIHPEIVRSVRISVLVVFMTMLAILMNLLASLVFQSLSETYSIPPELLFLALPLAFVPMALASVCGVRVALYTGLYVAIIAAVADHYSFPLLITGLIVSGASSYFVHTRLNYRTHFLAGVASTTLATLVCGFMMMWLSGMVFYREMLFWLLILPCVTGVYTSFLTQVSLYIMEFIFDATTNMSLLSFSDYNHPLLKKMQIEAPGTYHHSLVVSMLAEAAANEIGADPLQARVCALFHDVGKLSHPEYFTENSNGEDKHKDLKPQVSAMIILNHVKQGLELARKYRLKKPIRDGIAQHHGTDLVYFFYKRAMDENENCDEQDFRYDGPCPQTKEIAILSLADACEAASRSLSKPSHGKLEELVSEIIMKRLRKGQLDDAALTFRELTRIRDSFVKTLTSMLHARVAYPKEDDENEDDLFLDQANRKTPMS